MRSVAFHSFRIMAWTLFVGIVLQFAAAGLLLFVGWRSPHFLIGTLLPLASLVLCILAVLSRLGRRAISLSALLLVLLIAQHLILGFGQTWPWLRVFHILVPVALPIISLSLVRQVQPVRDVALSSQQHAMAKA